MTANTYLFTGTVFFYCLGSLASILAYRSRVAGWMAHIPGALACGLGTLLGLRILLNGETVTVDWGSIIVGLNYSFSLDKLGGFFLLIVCGVGLVGMIYSQGYVQEYLGRKNVGFLGCMYNLFLLSMVLVVSAANAFLFLSVWEVMAIVSYFLVTFEHEEPGVRRAGFIYVVMTHFGTIFIALAFLLLYRASGSLEFAAFKGLALSPYQKNLVFVFFLIGLGTKAGIVPLHIWLPRAHPAAPSNVSALMSGVMVKTAVYMLLRVVLDFTGSGPVWWGILVIALGLISAFMGVIYAMVQNDLGCNSSNYSRGTILIADIVLNYQNRSGSTLF